MATKSAWLPSHQATNRPHEDVESDAVSSELRRRDLAHVHYHQWRHNPEPKPYHHSDQNEGVVSGHERAENSEYWGS